MPFEAALLICGNREKYPLSDEVRNIIAAVTEMDTSHEAPPVLLVNETTHRAMELLHKFTPKFNIEDKRRVEACIEHYEKYIDFDTLLRRTQDAPYECNETDGISFDQVRKI